MAAGENLREFENTLRIARNNVDDIGDQVARVQKDVKEARQALEAPGSIERDADIIGRKIEKMILSIKVTEKAPGPLKIASKFLETVLTKAKKVFNEIEKKAWELDKKIERSGLPEKLLQADEFLEAIETDLENTEANLEEYRSATSGFIFAFDAAGNLVQPLSDAVDQIVVPPNEALAFINRKYALIEDDIEAITDIMTIADFSPVINVAKNFGAIKSAICTLEVPLNIAYAALKPLEPLLDAIGFIFKITVEPVLNFILDKLGITKLMNGLADKILALLPDIDVMNPLDNVLGDLGLEIDDFLAGGFDIDDWLNDIKKELIDVIGDPTDTPTAIGTPGDDEIYAGAGDDVIDPRAGDDRVFGQRGNDVMLASAGDDVLHGGRGSQDRVVFSGNFAEYDFGQRFEDGPLVFFHTDPVRGRTADGYETLVSVELIEFADLSLTSRQLIENVFRATGSELVGTGKDDFLFASGSAVEMFGRKGNDRLTGSDFVDILRGQRGDDVFISGEGEDQVIGGGGSDTWLFAVDNSSSGSTIEVDLADGTAWDGRQRDTLRSIENAAVQDNRDAELFGNDERNKLTANSGDDWIDGRAGNDTINGGDGRDLLIGGSGSDTVFGEGGNDTIVAGGRNRDGEYFDGGEGSFDRLIYSTDFQAYDITDVTRPNIGDQPPTNSVRIFAERGRIDRMNKDGSKVLASDKAVGIEVFVGSDNNDRIIGAPGTEENRITVDGGGGDDIIISNGARTAAGGRGSDKIIVTLPDENIGYMSFTGGTYDGNDDGGTTDTLDLTQLTDLRWAIRLNGALGNRIEGYVADENDELGANSSTASEAASLRVSGNLSDFEVVRMSKNDDEVWLGGNEKIEIFAGGGNDTLMRNNSNDGTPYSILRGEGGDDFLRLADQGEAYGGSGDDTFDIGTSGSGLIADGGNGDDFFTLRRFDGTLLGGGGYDTVSIDTSTVATEVIVNLETGVVETPGNINGIEIDRIGGFEQVIGSDELRDRITGRDKVGERLVGLGNSDIIDGGGGDDELFGGSGNDSLLGGRGDDFLHGGTGADYLEGGGGIDTASYAYAAPGNSAGEVVAGGFGNVLANLQTGTASTSTGTDTLVTIENLIGGGGNDTLIGDDGDNALSGGDGNDRLEGGGGRDALALGRGDDVAFGGAGRDTFFIDLGDADITGGAGYDVLDLGAADGTIKLFLNRGTYVAKLRKDVPVWQDTGTTETRSWNGTDYTPTMVLEADPSFSNSGDDLSLALPTLNKSVADRLQIAFDSVRETYNGSFRSVEEVRSGLANTTIFASRDKDIFDGSGSDGDTLNLEGYAKGVRFDLGSGNSNHRFLDGDTYIDLEGIRGTTFRDILTADGRANALFGNKGNDVLNGRAGKDLLEGGSGADMLDGGKGNDTLVGNSGGDVLLGGDGADDMSGGGAKDELRGGDGNDLMNGGSGNDLMLGGNGKDRMFGKAGADDMRGNAGDDTLEGGGGNDRYQGGSGADDFVLRRRGGDDVVADFQNADSLVLDDGLWSGDLSARQVASRFGEDMRKGALFSFDGGESILLEGVSVRSVIDNIEIA